MPCPGCATCTQAGVRPHRPLRSALCSWDGLNPGDTLGLGPYDRTSPPIREFGGSAPWADAKESKKRALQVHPKYIRELGRRGWTGGPKEGTATPAAWPQTDPMEPRPPRGTPGSGGRKERPALPRCFPGTPAGHGARQPGQTHRRSGCTFHVFILQRLPSLGWLGPSVFPASSSQALLQVSLFSLEVVTDRALSVLLLCCLSIVVKCP